MNDQNTETMYTSEGTHEHRETYLHHVYPVVECTFKFWHGNKTGYLSAAPVRFEHMTRDQAFTTLVYALNTGDRHINPLQLRYSEIHTRGIAFTPEQERLYQRLLDYCRENHMWVGTEAKLAVFAGLSYPIDRAITSGLVESGRIDISGSVNCWMITCEVLAK